MSDDEVEGDNIIEDDQSEKEDGGSEKEEESEKEESEKEESEKEDELKDDLDEEGELDEPVEDDEVPDAITAGDEIDDESAIDMSEIVDRSMTRAKSGRVKKLTIRLCKTNKKRDPRDLKIYDRKGLKKKYKLYFKDKLTEDDLNIIWLLIKEEASSDADKMKNIIYELYIRIASLSKKVDIPPAVGRPLEVDISEYLTSKLENKEYSLNSPEFAESIAKKEMEIKTITMKLVESIVEGIYKCRKCKNKRIRKYELQTRGSDEPMTVFLTCTNSKCGNKWRM